MDFLRPLFFGEVEKCECPVCGEMMEGEKSLSNPYEVWFSCSECGAVSDGIRYWESVEDLREEGFE